jgi:hypothetical protein
MTSARRNGKSLGSAGVIVGIVAGLLLGPFGTRNVAAQTTNRVVIDRNTGLAIYGFDPVCYFTDAKPMLGSSELEYRLAGAVWRFRNEGNRAAFADRPAIYMPRFGGYDPVAVGRGVATPGHPQIWLVAGAKLYLFGSAENRDGFIADEQKAIEEAEEKWPTVLRVLIN